MELSKEWLDEGLKSIVGKWEPDYVVNFFSNDLAHIPVAEFKSSDGNDLSKVKFEFFSDHTMTMTNTVSSQSVSSEWKQVDMFAYEYDLNSFLNVPADAIKRAERLEFADGHLCFGLGFLTVALKKTEDGHITKEPDKGECVMSAEDEANMAIAGKYSVYKTFAMIGEDFSLHTYDEVKAYFDKLSAEGSDEAEMYEDSLRAFDALIEFGTDHKVYEWMKVPEGAEEELKEALESGEIAGVKDGYFILGEGKDWKCLDGVFYYDTQETREVFGEVKSSWDEIKFDDEGNMIFGDGMMILKKTD